MKIAIVSPFITSNVPTEYYSSQQLNLAKSVVRKGHTVHIYTLNLEQNLRREDCLFQGALKIIHLPSALGMLKRAGFPLLKNLIRELRKESYDILQISGDYHPTAILAILSKLKGKKVLFQGVNEYSRSFLKLLMMRAHDRVIVPLLRKRTDLVIAKTSKAKRFMEELGFGNVVMLPAGYDPEFFYPAGPDAVSTLKQQLHIRSNNVALYVGNLTPLRNVSMQIKAFAKACKLVHDAQLIIVGDGPEKQTLKKLGRILNIESRVLFLDKLPNNKLNSFYSMASCLMLTSSHEIFGMVIPEALSCGCPVITTPIPASEDILQKNNSAVVPFGDYDKLADTLVGIFSGCHSFDRKAIIKSSEYLRWDNLTAQYLNYFSNLLQY